MRLILSFLLIMLTLPASAQCVGENLIKGLSLGKRTALDIAVADHPYPQGNLWRLQKTDSIIHVMGTFHLNDARFTDYLEPIWPIIDTADLVLLEGDSTAMKQLKAKITTDPSITFITDGPTLPELLTEEEWQQLSVEMSARGIPAFMVSKMRPWFVSMMLAIPPCAMSAMKEPNGVDQRIIKRAEAQNIPTGSLEPFDTVFSLFGDQDGLDMIRIGLAGTESGDAMIATMTDEYLAGHHRELWEFSRIYAFETMDHPKEAVAKMFSEMERVMLSERNINWIDGILTTAKDNDNLVIAVGAGHLSGEKGVLFLLKQAGYAVTRVDGF